MPSVTRISTMSRSPSSVVPSLLCVYFMLYSYSIDARLNSVIILEQKVPAAVLNGSEYVVLDCLYRLNPNKTEGLSVTWYFNNSPSLTYQWIPGFEVQTMGPLKSHILAGYKVNTDDELAKYRAVYIIRPTIELTGNYKCVVSTFYDEDFMIKKMTVYAPGQNLRMRRMKTVHRGQVNISCTISKVFPIPQIQMYIVVESNGTTNRNESLQITMLDYQNDDAFDVTVSTLVPESEISSQSVFYCELILPGTPYHTTKKFINNIDEAGYMYTENLACFNHLSPRMLQWTVIYIWLLIAVLE